MNEKDLFAAGLIVLVALAVSLSTVESPFLFTLDSYSNALNVEKAVKGEAVGGGAGLYYAAAALAYSRAAAFTGAASFSPGLLVSTLNILSALFAAVAGVATYYALRPFCSREASAFGAIMLFTSIAGVGLFLSGFISPGSLGLAAFMCGTALLMQALKRKDPRFALGGGIFAAIAMVAWGAAVIAFIALLVGMIAQAALNERKKQRNREFLLSAAAFAIAGLAGVGLAGFGSLMAPMDAVTEASLLLLFLPLILLALFVASVKAVGGVVPGDFDVLAIAFGLASIVGGLFSPAAALPGLALIAGYALEDLPEALQKRKIILLVAGCGAGFGAFVMLLGFLPLTTSAVLGTLIGFGGAFVAGMYRGEGLARCVAWSFAVVLAFASISSAILIAQSQQAPVDDEAAAALKWVSLNTPADAALAVTGQNDMYAYLSQRKAVSRGVAGWLLGNESAAGLKALGADYILLDVTSLDRLELLKNETGRSSVRMDSFGFAGFRSDEAGALYGAFVSQAGTLAYIPYDQSTGFIASSDVIVIDSAGNSRKVPFARFVLLRDSQGRIARAVYPYDNYDIDLFNAFFGSVAGLEKVYPEGEGTARIYGVGAG